MLRGNLSTRPFFNERLVTLVILLVGVIAVALTVFDATRVFALSKERRQLKAVIDANRSQSLRIRTEAERVQKSVDRSTLNALAASTREANLIIDARTFSWTSLFGHLEKTMPYDVKLAAVSPRIEKGVLKVEMIIIAKQLDDVATFIEELNKTNAFLDAVPPAHNLNEDGTYSARIDATYFSPRDAKLAVAATGPETKPGAPPRSAGDPRQGGSR